MLQVLANLVGNALKFTPPGGRIVVRAARVGDAVQICVCDTGEGIPDDERKTIFDRFAQGARHDRRGLGLGLYIARRIVEAHRGRIWVESTVGQGSAFYFELPGCDG
jgi:signal transduction histidine kinase